jgi:hypothetical protein
MGRIGDRFSGRESLCSALGAEGGVGALSSILSELKESLVFFVIMLVIGFRRLGSRL